MLFRSLPYLLQEVVRAHRDLFPAGNGTFDGVEGMQGRVDGEDSQAEREPSMSHSTSTSRSSKSIDVMIQTYRAICPSFIHNGISARSHVHKCKKGKRTGMHTHTYTFSISIFQIPTKCSTTPKNQKRSFIPMRITRLPHLTRKTRRRHDRFFILKLHLLHMPGHIPRRALRRNTTPLNLQLARLALFLRRQHSA